MFTLRRYFPPSAGLHLAILAIVFWCGRMLVCGADAGGADGWIRAQAGNLPLLESSGESGSPRFSVVRFNAPPLLAQGHRYGAVRVRCPADARRDLVWMFADVTNIDEYRLIPVKPGVPLNLSVRQIYAPTANLDIEDEQGRGRRASSLPRPWDIFQLHILGVPAAELVPGEEYIIWFRLSDRRPTDVLLAASFVAPLPKMEPAVLSPVLALPAQSGDP